MNGMPMNGQFYNPGVMMPMNGMNMNPMNGMNMNPMNGMNMMPMNNMGMPVNNMGMPVNNMGMPVNNMGMPMNNMGMQMNNMGMMYNNFNGYTNPMYMQNNMVYNNMGVGMATPNQVQIPNQVQTPNQNGENQEYLPRGNYVNGDINVAKGEDMMNITFDASTGVKTIVCVKKTTQFKDIFKEYVKKLGLFENVIGKQIVFLFNGKKLDENSEDTPKSLKLQNMASITVFDVGNVIGA
jgi:hypothetical protein